MPLSRFRTEENQLRFSEEQSNTWIEHSPVCTKIVDLDFNLQFMSSAGIEALAMDDVNEYYGKPYPFNFYPQLFCDEVTKNLKKALSTFSVVEQEAAVLDIHGNEVWFHSTISPVSEDGEKIDYLMVVSIDTTAQHIATKKLERLNDELEAKIRQRTLELETVNKQLHHQAETDFLTKLPNRLAFDRRIDENIATAKRNQQFLSLLMIDIDQFKNYNDDYGHDTGDVVLQKIAQAIEDSLPRATDMAARYGGEEFVILLPSTNIDAGFEIAERIRTNVEALAVQYGEADRIGKMTVSIGIASLQGDELNARVLLKQADKALFSAKKSGRNNCQISRF